MFLIPIKWFNKWKKHSFFYELNDDEEDEMMSDMEEDEYL